MRVLLLTAGSRGDVVPFLALARRARAEGHEVRLAVTREFVAEARAGGVEVAVLDGDFAELVRRQGVSPWAALRSYRSTVAPMLAAVLSSAVDAALDFRPDVLVHHPKVLSAPLAAAHLGVPHVLVEIVPTLTPTREFPAAGLGGRDLGPLNPLTHRVVGAASSVAAGALRDVRARLGLPARGPLPPPVTTLVPVSPVLLPQPQDWPATTVVTGAWHEPAPAGATRADAELDDFLARGDVVCAGFGSMAAGDAEHRAQVVLDAVRAAGRRALLVTGWGGLRLPPGRTGEDVLVRAEVVHEAVLPRCVAAVHHAGAGTAHAAVRAGVASVPVPFLADQPFWAARLHRQGLAARPVPARRLTAERLGRALAAGAEPERLAAAARAMAAEDGCGSALELITRSGTARRA
ncbi:glycosyltransferase [uncultured Pseudokineococcus sp.]|uniref:glycosyltransferase n=1 Tax=uncultured Pseudokineococcus sp. TaxID=1642928 RepID=UPI002604CC4E|nr:glycosyltransferase [uncultured Pseudokineococcus sp.]